MPKNINPDKAIKPLKNNKNESSKNISRNSTITNYSNSNSRQVKQSANSSSVNSEKPNYHLIFAFIVICILPLIVRLKLYNTHLEQFNWSDNSPYFIDLFLYYKQWVFIFIAAIMAIIIAIKIYIERKAINVSPIFIPLAIYAGLAFFSALLSEYTSFSFFGSFEQFESIFALLGYCVLAYYTFLFIRTEKDLRSVINFMLIAAIIMGFLGLLQYTGHDFYASDLGYNLIIPEKYRAGANLSFNMGKNRVYLSLYNPNYVGTYVALFVPVFLSILIFHRNVKSVICAVIAILGLVISVVGATSLTGMIGLGVAFLCFIIFMWRDLLKRFYITLPLIVIAILGFIIVNNTSNQYFTNKLLNNIENSKKVQNLTDVETKEDCVSLVYKGSRMNVQYVINPDQSTEFKIYDDNNQNISAELNTDIGYFEVTDERFTGIMIGMDPDIYGVFFIRVDNMNYRFTNMTEDGTYYYVNKFNKLDKMVTAPSAVFTGYEAFASQRGYIWSRTIPLLKNNIFLGSGPDTFIMEFPQNDYLNKGLNGFDGVIITKPHCLYLQIAVQTGILSLIAFLVFYGMYFVSSFRIYIKGRFSSYYAKVGVAIFISTIAYMVTGLANDSSITTAPIFWALIGIGIGVNQKAKPLIQEEIAKLKADKTTGVEA